MFSRQLYQWQKALGEFLSNYLYYYLFIELVAVSWGDIKYRKISNAWSLLNLATFFMLVIFFPSGYSISLSALLYPIIFFLAGFFLFVFGIMGGGDSKFLATFFLLIPPDGHDDFLLILLCGTILFAGGPVIYRSIRNFSQLWGVFLTRDWGQLKKYTAKNPLLPP